VLPFLNGHVSDVNACSCLLVGLRRATSVSKRSGVERRKAKVSSTQVNDNISVRS